MRNSGEKDSIDNQHDQHYRRRTSEKAIESLCDAGFDETNKSARSRRFNRVFHYYRYLVVMLGGLAVGNMMIQRFSISVALLNMVNQTHIYLKSNPDRTYDDFLAEGFTDGGDFDWNNEIQNIIMSWYMIAYTLPQIATTKIALKLGLRISVPLGLFICSTSNLLIPSLAYLSWRWVVVMRLINGIGASYVIAIALRGIERWMTHEEISLGLTIAQVLQVVLSSSSPLIAGYLSSLHWKIAFYIPAVVSISFGILYFILVTDNPEDNWLISERELQTIHEAKMALNEENSKPVEAERVEEGGEGERESKKQPGMLDLLKVPSFYAYLALWILHCSSKSSIMFLQPNYLRQFLKLETSQVGFYVSILEAGTIIGAIWPHPILKLLQGRFHLSPTASRRIVYGAASIITGTTWSYIGIYHRYQVVLFFLNRCCGGAVSVLVIGSLMSNYSNVGLSSISFSVMNTFGNLSPAFLSTFFGWFLDRTGQSETGWFWIYFWVSMHQILIILIFSTLIRSEPIKFKGATGKKEQDQVDRNKSEAVLKKI